VDEGDGAEACLGGRGGRGAADGGLYGRRHALFWIHAIQLSPGMIRFMNSSKRGTVNIVSP
jgi:hypothetical protein